MAQQKGVNAEILIGWESAYKTVATAGFIMPVNSCGVRGTQVLNAAQTLTGTRNPVAPFAGNRDVGGSIIVPADSEAMWYWLRAMFGDPTQSGVSPYDYEFKILSSMPSFSLETAFEDLAVNKYARYLGCKIARWAMEFGGDGELVANLDVVGAVDSLETSAFDGSPTTISLARVENFEAALLEGGGSISNATVVSFTIDFGLDVDNYVIGGAGTRGNLPEGIVGVTGNIKTLFESDALLVKAIAGTESSLKITVTASASSVLEVEFQEIEYERNSPDIPGPEGLMVDLNFQGFYDDGSETSAAVARLTNSTDHGL